MATDKRPTGGKVPLPLSFLARKPTIKTTSKRVIAVFGDLNGFSSWLKICEYSPKEFQRAILPFYQAFRIFERNFVKVNADGFLSVIEIPKGDASRVAVQILKQGFELCARIQEIINAMNYPSPSGFRMRISTGKVFELMAYEENEANRKRYEYIGYCINLADRMTRFNKTEPMIVDERFKQLIPPQTALKQGFRFHHVNIDAKSVPGIFPEDAHVMSSVIYEGQK